MKEERGNEGGKKHFNRTIVECRLAKPPYTLNLGTNFNRTIVECRLTT